MNGPLHIAQVTLDMEIRGDPQDALPPTFMDLGGAGKVVLHQAAFSFAGAMSDPRGGRRLIIAAGRSGCNCGCGAPGVAFGATPSVEEARMLARQLMTFADEIEREASDAAAAAIRRAAR